MQMHSYMTPNSISVIEKAFSHVKSVWEQEMMRLALEAYYNQGGLEFPDADLCQIKACRGTYYAYIANSLNVLAVYRIRDEESFSEKIENWPNSLPNHKSKPKLIAYEPTARDIELLWCLF